MRVALRRPHAASRACPDESLAWEADRALAGQIGQRIHAVAPDVHENPRVRVAFVGSYHQERTLALPGTLAWTGLFDTWNQNQVARRKRAMDYAGFADFRVASRADYDATLHLAETLPAWPDPGSVARSGNIVVVKLGPPNGYDLE